MLARYNGHTDLERERDGRCPRDTSWREKGTEGESWRLLYLCGDDGGSGERVRTALSFLSLWMRFLYTTSVYTYLHLFTVYTSLYLFTYDIIYPLVRSPQLNGWETSETESTLHLDKSAASWEFELPNWEIIT